MTSTLTPEQSEKIWATIEPMVLPSGIGNEKNACTIAAINIALGNGVVDTIPPCMSPVIGRWIIKIQDSMPHDIRNSIEWKRLAVRAAGTGREHEKQRLDLIINHLWTVALPLLQPSADRYGFGDEWREMLDKRTEAAAEAAEEAAMAAAAMATSATSAAWAARAASAASAAEAAWAEAANVAAAAAADVAMATATAAAWAVATSAAWAVAAGAANAVEAGAVWPAAEAVAAVKEAWKILNPIELLEQLITAGETEKAKQ